MQFNHFHPTPFPSFKNDNNNEDFIATFLRNSLERHKNTFDKFYFNVRHIGVQNFGFSEISLSLRQQNTSRISRMTDVWSAAILIAEFASITYSIFIYKRSNIYLIFVSQCTLDFLNFI